VLHGALRADKVGKSIETKVILYFSFHLDIDQNTIPTQGECFAEARKDGACKFAPEPRASIKRL
jgi:hypothetical protein